MKSGRSRLYTRSKQRIHNCRAKHQSGECQREGGTPSALGSGGGRLWLPRTVRDFWLFGEVVYVKNWTMTQYCSGCAQKDFLKGELKHV